MPLTKSYTEIKSAVVSVLRGVALTRCSCCLKLCCVRVHRASLSIVHECNHTLAQITPELHNTTSRRT
jgi:hypothetical protein